jgi:hypothetical protein
MTTTLKSYLTANVGLTATTVYNPTSAGIQSTVIGMTLANTTTSSVTANVTLTSGATTVYLIKNVVLPSGNTLSVLGDGKFIVNEDDLVRVQSSAASSVDVIVSTVEVV